MTSFYWAVALQKYLAWIEILYKNLPWGDWGKPWDFLLRLGDLQAEMLTEDILSTQYEFWPLHRKFLNAPYLFVWGIALLTVLLELLLLFNVDNFDSKSMII